MNDTLRYIYKSIRIYFDGHDVIVSQWCRAGREIFEVQTIGLDGIDA